MYFSRQTKSLIPSAGHLALHTVPSSYALTKTKAQQRDFFILLVFTQLHSMLGAQTSLLWSWQVKDVM